MAGLSHEAKIFCSTVICYYNTCNWKCYMYYYRVHEKYVRDLLFTDDVAITTHTQEDLQQLLDHFSDACRHFGLTISLAKMQIIGQDITETPLLFIHNHKLEVFHEFVYLRSLPSQTTCPSTVNSISELEKLPRHSPGSQNEYGPTTSFQIIPKSMYIKPV